MLVDSHLKSAGPKDPFPGAAEPAGRDRAAAAPSPTKGIAALVVLLLIGLALYRFIGGTPGRPEATAKPAALIHSGDAVAVPDGSPVRSKLAIASVIAREVSRDLALPAVVEVNPARLIKVAPPLAGRVTQLKVTLGEQVKAGQPLFSIDSPDLAAAYSDYDRAKALLALAQKNRDRQRGLSKIGGAAEKDLQQAETDYATAEVEDQRATAHLKQIGIDPETPNKSRTVTVVAPMDGSVTDLGVAPGEYWNDSTQALLTVSDLSSVWVTASVPEKDIAQIVKGQPVDVRLVAYPDEIRHGNVLFVSDVLDADTRRTKVRIAFDNADGRLRPGMFATATFHAGSRTLATAPTSALLLKDDLTQVYVETSPWQFEPRTVDIAFQQGEQAFIAKGIKPGDRIVVKGGVLLGD
ncbi:efflux RND transporter periplasmic adaptor subunit [Bradyrhizobium arachidis]|uniref:efflux RND transporter periplasmic adaptor subunit n=1 Tax=Bradyrhizobium TaxID=374 RepID=UPI002162345C|nr:MULTISPECIES: efflux RND transporter periplasmic adaptor subunit [Bradyrhizobium]MDN4983310.1 efflux RND transporter periplasmic adaptor subunit [Bradyrhizobium sp. WYCCWR 13022]UVO34815.1 efflux RND transporter periplasmic adaptor subunit [Bradyrhizobium arachidis]